MIRFCLFLMSFSFLSSASGQSSKAGVVSDILVYGDYSYGLPIYDSSAVLLVKLVTKSYVDTVLLEFNSVGRIIKHISRMQECSFSYAKDKVSKIVKSKHPMKDFMERSEYVVDYYYVNGKVTFAKVVCEGKTYRIDYGFSFTDDVVVVKSKIRDELLTTDVVLFDSKGGIQWQTINAFGGFALNYSFLPDECISNLGFDTSVLYGVIVHETVEGGVRRVLKDQYTVYDLRHKPYGEIIVERQTK